jgi:hypothetical protein
MGFLLESPGQLADSQVPYLSTRTGALHCKGKDGSQGDEDVLPCHKTLLSRTARLVAEFGANQTRLP